MLSRLAQAANWLLGPPRGDSPGHLGPRWIFLRAMGVIFFSAFFSLLFQAPGLIGPNGILPADSFLSTVARYMPGLSKYWFAPSVFWLGSSDHAMILVCWIGMVASVLLILNVWPRGMTAICLVCFLSLISTLQDFSSYQSDGMLMEAGFLCLFFAPRGFLPRWGELSPPSRASLFLLLWEWFRIYFESGIGKMLSGDPEWRHLTAMVHYYQDGPLPSWIGWYIQHLPFWVHWTAALATLIMEMGIVLMLFLPRRFRIICFCVVTPWEIMVILTANYAFLNYLVFSLGFLLLDDRLINFILPAGWFPKYRAALAVAQKGGSAASLSSPPVSASLRPSPTAKFQRWRDNSRRVLTPVGRTVAGLCFAWVFYSSTVQLLWMVIPGFPFPRAPIEALEPFRIANQYGLFEVMTRGRYEIEFQGSNDNGQTWTPYPYRFKPQALDVAPGIYAPYQPRFDWNLWFASLGSWREYPFVVSTEEALLDGSPEVLELFANNPFPAGPPKMIRAVIWQYWFTDMATKRRTGDWWRREYVGLYAPVLIRQPDGRFAVLQFPGPLPEHKD